MARMPPSRRIAKYKSAALPLSSIVSEKASSLSHSKSTQSSSPNLPTDFDKDREGESERQEVIRKGKNEDEEIKELTVQLHDGVLAPGLVMEELIGVSSRTTSSTVKPTVQEGEIDPEDIARYGLNKSKKIKDGKIAIEHGKVYDLSLWKAMWKMVRLRWIILNCFQLSGGEFLRCSFSGDVH